MKFILFSPPNNVANETTLLTRCFELGLDYFHLRKPMIKEDQLVIYLSNIPAIYHKRIVLHQHYALAEKFQIKGIHLPEAERLVADSAPESKSTTISTSFHSLKALIADDSPYEYVFLSPIFDSISKPGYKAAFEEDDLRAALRVSKQKVIALGGIAAANIGRLGDMGFAGVAVLGAVWGGFDALEAYKELVGSLVPRRNE